MTTLVRTDIHRPSAINPAEYEYVGFELVPRSGDVLGDVQWQLAERAKIKAHMARTGGTYSQHAHGGNCMVCGNANAIYTVLFHHGPSNTYVRMGQDCAAKCEVSYDSAAFNAFRTKGENARKAIAGKRKAQAILQQAGLEQAWSIYDAGNWTQYEEQTIGDIVGKLIKYGSISDKQLNYVRVLVNKIPERETRQAARAAEVAAAAPLPQFEGRVQITGEVLSTKWVDTPFGRALKMLVKHDTGWKVWGTVPSNAVVQRGNRVTFTATVERSKDDPKFGFFSRPSNLVNHAEPTVELPQNNVVPFKQGVNP